MPTDFFRFPGIPADELDGFSECTDVDGDDGVTSALHRFNADVTALPDLAPTTLPFGSKHANPEEGTRGAST